MLGVAGQQREGMGKQRQDGAEAALCARRAPRKVDDERSARYAADAAAKSRKGCLLSTAQADLFSDAWNKAITDRECGFGSQVTLCQACAPCG